MLTSKDVSIKLMEYRNTLDPYDKMQVDNFKWVERFIVYTSKKVDNWEEYCYTFLEDAIDIQFRLLEYIEKRRS